MGLGYEHGAIIFGAVLASQHVWTRVSLILLSLVDFILTRPPGTTLGDLLDMPVARGGLYLSRLHASLIVRAVIVACVSFIPQRAAGSRKAGAA